MSILNSKISRRSMIGLLSVSSTTIASASTWNASRIMDYDPQELPDGATIIFSGRNSPHDGGGGTFTYVKREVYSIDNGLVFAAKGGGRLIRNGYTLFGYNGPASIAFWGASNDGNDNGGFKAAVEAANLMPMDLVLLPGTNAISNSIDISVRYKLLGGKTSTVKAIRTMKYMISIGSGRLGARDNSASNYGLGGIDGVTFDANNMADHCAIYGGGEYPVTGYSTKESKFINSTSDNVKTLNNFFICQFYSCSFNNGSGNSFVIGAGNNAGENISFYGCAFFNSGRSAFKCEDSGPGGASISFYGCSFDYYTDWAIENGHSIRNATVISMFGGHIENTKNYCSNYGTMNFYGVNMIGGLQSGIIGYLIDNQGGMEIAGGWIQNAGTGIRFNPNGKAYFASQTIGIFESYPSINSPGNPIEEKKVYQNKSGSYMDIHIPYVFGKEEGYIQAYVGANKDKPEFLIFNKNGKSSPTAEYLTIRVPPFYFYQIITHGAASISSGHVISYG